MSQVEVTNSVISIGKRFYQVRNITSIGKFKMNPSYMINWLWLLIFIGLTSMGFFMGISEESIGFFNWLNIIFGILSLIGIWERNVKKPIYGIDIETNSGKARAVASRDQSLIDEIMETMFQVMRNQNVPVNRTFNIVDGDLINQAGVFGTGVSM